ncbi:MAG: ATP-binding cassette domain-containing protein [Mariprofundus sp.]|nr:ATP-binding cassette domain-containing protein [Mariprofundus sp.]
MKNHLQLSAQLGNLNLQADISFEHDFILVTGENGAGKTTLLRAIAGFEAVKGQLIVNHTVWLDSGSAFNLPTRKRKIGCLWSDPALLPWLSVKKNILFGCVVANEAWLQELAAALEVTHLMERRVAMLSTGEAQRIALARALYKKPKLLLLDEPLSAQAPALRQRLRKLLKSYWQQQEMTLIMVSHDPEDTKFLANQHWCMREGRLFAEVLHQPNRDVIYE